MMERHKSPKQYLRAIFLKSYIFQAQTHIAVQSYFVGAENNSYCPAFIAEARPRKTYDPILANNLPADATNTKRLYFLKGGRWEGSDYDGHLLLDMKQST